MAEENKPGQETSSANADAQDKLQSSKEHARKAAEDLKSAAGAFAGEYRGKAEQAWGDARGKAEQAWGERGIAPALSKKMPSNTCVKIQQRRFLPRWESASCWVWSSGVNS